MMRKYTEEEMKLRIKESKKRYRDRHKDDEKKYNHQYYLQHKNQIKETYKSKKLLDTLPIGVIDGKPKYDPEYYEKNKDRYIARWNAKYDIVKLFRALPVGLLE